MTGLAQDRYYCTALSSSVPECADQVRSAAVCERSQFSSTTIRSCAQARSDNNAVMCNLGVVQQIAMHACFDQSGQRGTARSVSARRPRDLRNNKRRRIQIEPSYHNYVGSIVIHSALPRMSQACHDLQTSDDQVIHAITTAAQATLFASM